VESRSLVDVRARGPTVDVARRGEDQAVDVELARRGEHVLRPVEVDLSRQLRVIVGARGARDRGEVDHGVNVPHCHFDVAVLPDVPPDEVETAIERPEEVSR
jgi:hypothetical protein